MLFKVKLNNRMRKKKGRRRVRGLQEGQKDFFQIFSAFYNIQIEGRKKERREKTLNFDEEIELVRISGEAVTIKFS